MIRDGVWICSFREIKGLTMALRFTLVQVQAVTITQQGRETKMELLYNYLTSQEFRGAFEAIIDGFKQIQDGHNSEKLRMMKFWKEREKQLERVLTNAVWFYGSLKGIAAASIPDIKLLEVLRRNCRGVRGKCYLNEIKNINSRMKNTEIKTIAITPRIKRKINEAIRVSLEFEAMTEKQLNITSIVGEILVSDSLGMELVVNDGNECYDAIDKDKKKVQIKARRYKGVESAMTGTLLNKNFKVGFDYAILVLLNEDYSFRETFRIDAKTIQKHFNRINKNRHTVGKAPRKTMSIAQFRGLATRQLLKQIPKL